MHQIGNTFTILESVDSTNNYAMAKVHAGLAKHGNAYFTGHQTAGKGQRGKHWASSKGENIALSCILQPFMLSLENHFQLSMAVALACYDLINHYTMSETSIKWPNDIYWRDRKAGGILIENNIQGEQWIFAVAGIGLNINQTLFPEELRNPVSLKQITGRTFDIVEMAKELCNHLQKRFETLSSKSMPKLLSDYNSILYKKGQIVRLAYKNAICETVIKGVNEEGQLIATGPVDNIFNWGEVEWIS